MHRKKQMKSAGTSNRIIYRYSVESFNNRLKNVSNGVEKTDINSENVGKAEKVSKYGSRVLCFFVFESKFVERIFLLWK